MWPFSKDNSVLGIDIGTSSIKAVQLKKDDNVFKLENYGELITYGYLEQPNNAIQTSTLKMLDNQVAELLRNLLSATKTTTKKAVFSIPLFSSFVTLIEMPRLTQEEVAKAIDFEAHQYVPVPINEVVLDWSIVGSVVEEQKPDLLAQTGQLGTIKTPPAGKIQVLLVAVPKEVVEKYNRIARLSNLQLVGLEVESFALAKALVGRDTKPICILDIGARSTNICIVDNGYVKLTHNLDTSGGEITRALANSLNVSYQRAEDLKKEQGLKVGETQREIYGVLVSILDIILSDVEKYVSLYSKKNGRNIDKIILNGGSAHLLGLDKYISDKLHIAVQISNPFKFISYPQSLNPIVKDIGPTLSIAIGLAMSY